MGTLQARQQRAGDGRGHGEHHPVVGAERDRPVGELERRDRAVVLAQGAQRVLETYRHALLGEVAQRRLDEHRAEPLRGDQRPAGGAALGQGFA